MNELTLAVIEEIRTQHKLHMDTIKDVVFSLEGDKRVLNQYNEYLELGADQMHDLIGVIKEVCND